jgi:DNA-binding IscR family transcriptional regulator
MSLEEIVLVTMREKEKTSALEIAREIDIPVCIVVAVLEKLKIAGLLREVE